MKTWNERLPGMLAFIEFGNGFAKKKAEEEFDEMSILADEYKSLCRHYRIRTKIKSKKS